MATRTWIAIIPGNWSDPGNWDGAATVPSGTDDVVFDGGVSNDNCTIDNVGTWSGGTITFTNWTGTINASAALDIVTAAFAISGACTVNLSSLNSLTCSGNLTVGASSTFHAPPTLTLNNDAIFRFAAGSTFHHNSGTVIFSNSFFPTLFGAADGSVIAMNTVKFVNVSNGGAAYIGGGLSFVTFWDNDGANAHDLTFEDPSVNGGITYSFNNFLVSGSAGKLIHLTSQNYGAPAFVGTKVGTYVSCDYLSIDYSTVDASPKWYAGSHSTDGGGNTNWIFTDPPAGGGDVAHMGKHLQEPVSAWHYGRHLRG